MIEMMLSDLLMKTNLFLVMTEEKELCSLSEGNSSVAYTEREKCLEAISPLKWEYIYKG